VEAEERAEEDVELDEIVELQLTGADEGNAYADANVVEVAAAAVVVVGVVVRAAAVAVVIPVSV